jgi:hypothetical protein
MGSMGSGPMVSDGVRWCPMGSDGESIPTDPLIFFCKSWQFLKAFSVGALIKLICNLFYNFATANSML